jgi:16S rRNA (cytidine1402-2'-O)-methyltransferase
MIGTLYIVASPIGCLQDISARALEILRTVDIIACEDTRHSATLLQFHGISTPLKAYHSHNEKTCSPVLLAKLQQGQSIALLSDAGTPLVHDPGQALVSDAHASGVRVVPIPGPCALITALSAAGLSAAQFIFAGFLPVKTVARKKQLALILNESRTVIFYEAPHRILASLQDMIETLGGGRSAVLARELTKMHETILSGSLTFLQETLLKDPNQQKGEFVILIAGIEAQETDAQEQEAARILSILSAELPLKQAASLTAQITGVAKNKVYAQGLKSVQHPPQQ